MKKYMIQYNKFLWNDFEVNMVAFFCWKNETNIFLYYYYDYKGVKAWEWCVDFYSSNVHARGDYLYFRDAQEDFLLYKRKTI